jgi:hypothetical protein
VREICLERAIPLLLDGWARVETVDGEYARGESVEAAKVLLRR